MSRRLPGSWLLIMLALGLFYTRPVWAGSNGEQVGTVLVRVSPLALLLENEVTITVGEFTCHLVNGVDPSSQCTNLPPGEYAVSASSDGYIVSPPSYQLTIPGDEDNGDEDNGNKDNGNQNDADAASVAAANAPAAANDSEFYFKLYQIRNELYLPTVQVKR